MAGFAHRAWLGATVLLAACFCTGSAQAGVEACYALQTQFSPNDVALAAQFVSEHGECLAHFEDPAFQSVAGALTGLTASGTIAPGQCKAVLDNKNSQAAKQLLALADGGVVSSYLDCGCAVADSGVAKKIKEISKDIVSCADAFNPSKQIMAGLAKAGDVLGLDTLWGLAGEDHDPRAGVGYGGMEQTAYDVAACSATGVPINGSAKAWDGSWLTPGQHVFTCHCPSPTRTYADGHFIPDTPGLFHSPTFSCMACPPGVALKASGSCSVCENKQGADGFEYWNPNKDGSACVVTHVDKNCDAGSILVNGECTACPANFFQYGSACLTCGENAHSDAGATVCAADPCSGNLGLLPGSDECGVCPENTQLKKGVCEACPQGATSSGGDDFCKIENYGFGGVSCPAGTVHPPGDPMKCVCAPGYAEVNGVCQPVPKLQLRSILQPTKTQN